LKLVRHTERLLKTSVRVVQKTVEGRKGIDTLNRAREIDMGSVVEQV
jgi:hypothetical protein